MSGNEESNYLGMSDEEFSKLPLPDDSPADTQEEEESSLPATEEVDDQELDEESTPDFDAEAEQEEKDHPFQGEVQDDEQSHEDSSEEEGSDDQEEEEGSEQDDSKNSEAQKQLDELYAPFQANGREMKISNVAEARQLMQMGANYNKKMAAIKPFMRTGRMLENNGLLDEEKLSFLIDLHNKEPKAISKLLADSKIDPMDIDLDDGVGYTPSKSHAVSDNEVELSEVINELKGSAGFDKTLDVVTDSWDKKSQQIVVENPHLMRVIHDHVSTGVYDQITDIVEKERTFGRLSGLSDIEAYRQVSEQLASQVNARPQEAAHTKEVKNTNTNAKQNPNLNKKKRAAGSPKSTPAPKKPSLKDFNPLGMNDEDFEKEFSKHFR